MVVTGTTALLSWLPAGGGLRDKDWAGRHRLMTRLLAVSMAALVVFGALHDELSSWNLTTWLLLLTLPCLVAAVRIPGRRLPSIFVSLGFTMACAAFVAMTHGQTEAHFTFFIAVGALALYRDWAPFGIFLAATTAHHALFGLVNPELTYGHHSAQRHPLFWAAVHGVAVLLAAAFQVIAWRLTEAEERRARKHLQESQAQLSVAFDETRRHRRELRDRVRHDELTGLLSRSAFEHDLAARLATGEPVSVLYLDVDRFKSINDASGHAVGDELLRALAVRLRDSVPTGSLVARLSADEFVVAPAGSPAAATQVGYGVLAAFAEPLRLGDEHLQVSLSVGLATGQGAGQADDTVLAADTAMFTAKRAGGNRLHIFTDEMRAEVRERLDAEARLREALAGDPLETLPVWFQPIVSAATGEITGAEALVRMRAPSGEILGPGQFIPAAEETGLIVQLGEHVMRRAVCRLIEWDEHLGYVSVNVSPRQLAEAGFVPMLAGLLARHPGLDPSRLVVELTETALLGFSADVRERLDMIKQLGVRIALDDFGTGYSSLTWLQSVPADVVKLDRSFVAGLSADPRKASIIRAVVWLARSLGMSVVAEGVEDPADWQALRDLDCPSAQGYLFGRPLPAAEFAQVLRQGAEQAA